MIAAGKWLCYLFTMALLFSAGMLIQRRTQPPAKVLVFDSFVSRQQSNMPSLLLWVNGTCPLSRQYVPHLKHIIQQASLWNWNTVLVSVQDSVCDPLFRQLGVSWHVQDTQALLANWFNVSVIPTAMLFRSFPDTKNVAAGLVYQGAIDNWASETGKHRQNIDEHFLQDAMEDLHSGHSIRNRNTKPFGCFIEYNQ